MTIEAVKEQLNKIEKDNAGLKERVQSLQRELYAVTILFVGIGGVGAYFLSKVPDLKAEKEAIVTDTIDAKKEIAKYASSELVSYSGNATDGCARTNDLQICWGKKLSELNSGALRTFRFTFNERFAETPVVAESIAGYNPTNEGFPFAVYSSSPSPTEYNGELLAIRGETPATAEAWVSYLAIGKWRLAP